MSGKPAATVGSMHICPMCSGIVPHVGGPVIGPGSPNVLINGKPAVTIGDMCTCAGPPDTIVQGNPTVLINGKPIACMGDMTAHGGVIISGESTVIIGSNSSSAPTQISPVKRIPFPEIRVRDKMGAFVTGNGKTLKEAKENIESLKNSPQNEVSIADMFWKKDEETINETNVAKKVMLTASITGIDEGEYIPFRIYEKDEDGEDDYVDSVLALVENGTATAEWKVKYVEDTDDVESAKELQEKQYTLPEFVFKFYGATDNVEESNLLQVVDFVEVTLIDEETGEPLANCDYTLILTDGELREGTLDENGYAKIENVSPLNNNPIVVMKDDQMLTIK